MSLIVKTFLFVLVSFAIVSASFAYRILGIFPHNSRSHNIVFQALMKGLAKHGHQVDVISPYPLEKPPKNYHHIVNLAGMQTHNTNNLSLNGAYKLAGDLISIASIDYGNRLCEYMGLEQIQKLVKNPPKDPSYDFFITEALTAHCFIGIGYVLKVPVATISSGPDYPWISDFTGNDDNLAYVPNAFFYVGTPPLNFYQRLMNVVINYYVIHEIHRLTTTAQTEMMRRYLDPKIPDVRQLERDVSLVLVNAHPVLSGVKPIVPSFIQIAGIHVEMNDESLQSDLKKWMDESTAGVVYFSFGSKVLLESFPEQKLKQIYSSSAKISPVRVLVKVVNITNLPDGLPRNVKCMPWIPQQPVLAHPNTKIFITHGGLGSIQEALYYGVPMIGIPFFADQHRNVGHFAAKRMMIEIDVEELSEKTLDSALQALLHESIYRENAKYYSKLFRDRPISATDDAVFWIEFIIRNGPDVLKSPAVQLSFVQLALLDVYGFLLFTAFFFSLLAFMLVKILIGKVKKIVVSLKKIKAH